MQALLAHQKNAIPLIKHDLSSPLQKIKRKKQAAQQSHEMKNAIPHLLGGT